MKEAGAQARLYIEAFGAPGVGKSYVTKRVVESLRASGGTVRTEVYPLARSRRLARVARKIALVFRHSAAILPHASPLIRLTRRTQWSSLRGALRALGNWVQLVAAIRHLHRDPAPVLLVQGVLQAIWSLAFRARADEAFPLREWLELSLRVIPARELTVLQVTARAETIQARLSGRTAGQSVLDREGGPAAIQRGESLLRDILMEVERLEQSGRLRLVRFDNSGDGITEAESLALATRLALGNSGRSIDVRFSPPTDSGCR